MSRACLIIGESGCGKSTSIEHLNPEETFLINVENKPLPFRGHKSKYKMVGTGEGGNCLATDNYELILKYLRAINKERLFIKNIIIDDFQYIMCNEFMGRATEKGYGKFAEIGQHAWFILNALSKFRDDLNIFVLSHSMRDEDGVYRCKTIGKMLDNTITVEGLFTVVLHALLIDGHYKFQTQVSVHHLAKSPRGMFNDMYIDNNLQLVIDAIKGYE